MCARWEGGGRTLMKPLPLIAKNWLAVGMHGECGDNSTTCPLRIFCTFDDCPQAQLGGSGGTAHACVLLGLERHACKGSGGDRSGDRLARQLEETSALLAAGASSSLDFFLARDVVAPTTMVKRRRRPCHQILSQNSYGKFLAPETETRMRPEK